MIEKAQVNLKLTTSEWNLVHSALEFTKNHHANHLGDGSIPAKDRAFHREQAGRYEDLISKLR